MKTLEELRARLGEIHDALRAIDTEAGDAVLTPDQQVRFDALIAEQAEVRASEQAIEARNAQRATIAALPRQAASAQIVTAPAGAIENGDGARGMDRDPLADPRDSDAVRGGRDPWALDQVQVFGRSQESLSAELRSRALDAAERMPAMTDARRSKLVEIIEEFDDPNASLSRQVLIASNPAYFRAFAKAMRGRESEWDNAERGAVQQVRDLMRAMSLTDAAGGYLIPQQLDPTLILASDGSVNPIRQLARKVVATGDVWQGVTATDSAWSYDAEAAEVSDDTSTFAQPSISIYKAAGFVPISIEALADEPNVTGAIARLMARGKDNLEATQFVTGSGSSQPFGIVAALTGGSSVVASATTDTFAVGDLYAVEEALPARFRTNAAWVAGKATYNDVRQFGTSDSHALWERIGNGQPPELLGYRAFESSAIDATINASADNYTMVLGDWEHFVIADRMGMTLEYIPHLFHTSNNRPSGSRGFYGYVRHGSDSVLDSAFRMLNVT